MESKEKKNHYLIPKGNYYVKLPKDITTHIHAMGEFGMFVKSIGTYTRILNYAYGEFRNIDFYIGVLHQIRMLIDGLCKFTAFYLTETKETFLSRYVEDSRVDNQKYNGRQLTTNVVLEYLEGRYTGIKNLYAECNRYVHPTIFFDKKHKDTGYWFTSIKYLEDKKAIFDFFFDVSNNILLEILIETFNTYAVPKYGLEPTRKKKLKYPLAYTEEALEAYKKAKKIPSAE